jgi:hypothetical protein
VLPAALFEKQVSANADLFFDVFNVTCRGGIGWNGSDAHKVPPEKRQSAISGWRRCTDDSKTAGVFPEYGQLEWKSMRKFL